MRSSFRKGVLTRAHAGRGRGAGSVAPLTYYLLLGGKHLCSAGWKAIAIVADVDLRQ